MAFASLYQNIILDHYRNPRNFEELKTCSTSVEHENPMCGDRLKLMLQIDENNDLQLIKFQGHGCAISMASASMMTEQVQGRSLKDIEQIVEEILIVMGGQKESEILDKYGDLAALRGVMQFPVRVKCASMAWTALKQALSSMLRDK